MAAKQWRRSVVKRLTNLIGSPSVETIPPVLIRVVIFPGGAIQDYPAAKDPKTKRTTEICPL